MRKSIEERVFKHAEMFLKRDATVRSVADESKWGRQTVFRDITERLKVLNEPLYEKIQEKLKKNQYLGQVRGGLKVQEKYLGTRKIYTDAKIREDKSKER